jgi:predicted nucleic acid-binding protein
VKRSFVADASVAIAWVHPAEATPETDAMLDCLSAGDSLVVPALWPLEVANELTVLRRRRKLTPDEARTAIEIIRELPAIIDHEAAAVAFTRLLDLASEHELSV